MPLEQTGNPVTFYAFFTNSGSGATGLVVTADVWEVRVDGTTTEILSGVAATEIGDGLYRYRLVAASVDEEGEYIAVFKTAGACDQAHIPAIWVIERAGIEYLDQTLSTIAAAVWAVTAEGGHTYADIQRIFLAVLAGRSTGGGTNTIAFRDVANAKDRVRVQVDTSGNRVLIITLDGT